MNTTQTIVARRLRDYYNECQEILEQLNEEEITYQESEKALIQLDEKYAKLITEIFEKEQLI